jgi:hypothetical protein
VNEIKLTKIEETARATQESHPGPWRHVAVRFMQHEVHCAFADPEERDQVALCDSSIVAEHIANCSPDAVLALIERIRQLEGDLAEVEKILDRML